MVVKLSMGGRLLLPIFISLLLCKLPSIAALAAYGNCPPLTIRDLGSFGDSPENASNEGLIPQIIGNNASISALTILCASPGTVEGTHSSAAARVEYYDAAIDDGFPRRFSFVCSSGGKWAPHPEGGGPHANAAEFVMVAECSTCSPTPPESGNVQYDSNTFCVCEF